MGYPPENQPGIALDNPMKGSLDQICTDAIVLDMMIEWVGKQFLWTDGINELV